MTAGADDVIAAGGIPAVVVVYEAVVVVIDSIARNFLAVDPMVVDEVHVVVIGATALQNGHHNAVAVGRGAASGDVPREFGINVVVRGINVVPLRAKL